MSDYFAFVFQCLWDAFQSSSAIILYVDGLFVVVCAVVRFKQWNSATADRWKDRAMNLAIILGVIVFVGVVFSYAPYQHIRSTEEKNRSLANEVVIFSNSVTDLSEFKRKAHAENNSLREQNSLLTNRVDMFAIASGLTNLPFNARVDAFFKDYEDMKRRLESVKAKSDPFNHTISSASLSVRVVGKSQGKTISTSYDGEPCGALLGAHTNGLLVAPTRLSNIRAVGDDRFELTFSAPLPTLSPSIGTSIHSLTNAEYIQVEAPFLLNNLPIFEGEVRLLINNTLLKTFQIQPQASQNNMIFIRNVQADLVKWIENQESK